MRKRKRKKKKNCTTATLFSISDANNGREKKKPG
jgi:hypothetical protein